MFPGAESYTNGLRRISFFNPGSLAAQLPQVVKLRAAHMAAGHHFDRLEEGECSGKTLSTPSRWKSSSR